MGNNQRPSGDIGRFILIILYLLLPSPILFLLKSTKNIYQAILVILIYLFITIFLSFLNQVWKILEARMAEKLADSLDRWRQRFFSFYLLTYYKHLQYQHRYFDVKGLTTQSAFHITLEKVYVELSLSPCPPDRISADPVDSSFYQDYQEPKFIWEFLKTKPQQSLVIIGAPGCGKTTLFTHIVLNLALHKINRPAKKIPIMLRVRDHSKRIKSSPDTTLVDEIQDRLAKYNKKAPNGWFENQLNKGRCLVMLDGLDEVADEETRGQVVAWVERQMGAYAKNQFLISSRPHGYQGNELTGVTTLRVHPFTNDQTNKFIHKWYLANEIMSSQKYDVGVKMKAQEDADELLDIIPYDAKT
jgi:hypothetical protein